MRSVYEEIRELSLPGSAKPVLVVHAQVVLKVMIPGALCLLFTLLSPSADDVGQSTSALLQDYTSTNFHQGRCTIALTLSI